MNTRQIKTPLAIEVQQKIVDHTLLGRFQETAPDSYVMKRFCLVEARALITLEFRVTIA